MATTDNTNGEVDFIVVGAGAGGATVASRLALLGHRVVVLDAGGNGSQILESQVPLFHPFASEHPELAWRMFVRHYADDARQDKDTKAEKIDGRSMILYPRGSGMGGSTVLHAMISIYPHESDWDEIAKLTGDDSWKPDAMREHFRNLERCQYRIRPAHEDDPSRNPTAHGFRGWLPTYRPSFSAFLNRFDEKLLRLVAAVIVLPVLEQAKPDLDRLMAGFQQVKPLLVPAVARSLGPLVNSEKFVDDFAFFLATGLLDVDDRIPDDPGGTAIADTVTAIRQLADRIEQVIAHPLETALQQIWLISDLGQLKQCARRLWSHLDPNDWRFSRSRQTGPCLIPLSVDATTGQRYGLHKRLAEAQASAGDRLKVVTNALVAQILTEETQGGIRATGIQYFLAPAAYSAAVRYSATTPKGPLLTIACRREVILAGGTFNTPQLLTLSGIGPRDELERLNANLGANDKIPVQITLPGIGRNLQDRYEVGITYELPAEFSALKDSICNPDVIQNAASDAAWQQWVSGDQGFYASNGALMGLILKSPQASVEPDLFLFALPGDFHGYYTGYSKKEFEGVTRRRLSWIILKAHTRNRSGRVTLRGHLPWQQPEIQFNSFDQASDPDELDLNAVAYAIKTVRKLMQQIAIPESREISPGPDVTGDALLQWIRDEAWGHHAGGTCAIGAAGDPNAVLDGDFRVRGTSNLRVVDASIFPKIPGFFPVVPICMAAEKAATVIHRATLQPNLTPAPLPMSTM